MKVSNKYYNKKPFKKGVRYSSGRYVKRYKGAFIFDTGESDPEDVGTNLLYFLPDTFEEKIESELSSAPLSK